LASCLAAPFPAVAGGQDRSAGERIVPLSGISRDGPRGRAPALPETGRFGFSSRMVTLPDGSKGKETTLLGSVPLSDRLEAGVGLFSVSGADAKERDHRRIDPLRDVGPRRSRVAAVGLRMRF
jgi:hypothetical protein